MTPAARFLWSLLDLDGTASRKRALAVFGLMLALTFAASYATAFHPQFETPAILLLGTIFMVWTATKVQRLHAASRSGYWALTTLFPLIPAIVILCLPPAAPSRPNPIARRIGGGLLVLLALLTLSRAFLWHPYVIPSESNKPTLMRGDYVIATRAGTLAHGDMVVYRDPADSVTYVKRVIGLGGDTVQMRDGVVVLNGASLPKHADGTLSEPYDAAARQHCANTPDSETPCLTPRFTETLPDGRSYSVLDIETGPLDDTDSFTVPQGMIFVMGDHRDNSRDSRCNPRFGMTRFVAADAVIGRARWVLFSMSSGLIAGRNWLTVQ